jgi:predicted permease
VAARLAAEYPDTHKNLPSTYVQPQIARVVGDAREAMLILWGAVALVLLITCANLANMLLARTADRQHEIGVRLSIGGSRSRIVRQLLTENLTIAAAGAVVGLAGAMALIRLLVPLAADSVPRFADVGIDPLVLEFTVGLALVVTVLVTVPPALWISRSGPARGLRSESRASTGTQERLRGALVIAQVSIGLMLLSIASVLGAGLLQLVQRDLGFKPDALVTFRVGLSGARYSATRQIASIDQLLDRLRTIPGVADATVGMPLPVTGNEMSMAFDIEERPAGPSERPSANMAIVGSSYFRTIGTPVLEGRAFTEADDERHERVLVVNKAFAERFFPGASAIGKRITSGATSDRDPQGVRVLREIVGIVGNAKQELRTREPEPIYYFPYKQLPWGPPSVVMRTSLPLDAVVPEVRRVVAAFDRQVPVHDVTTLNDIVARGMAAPRFVTLLMSSFAAMGLLLTATGLYGLLSYAVSRRSREIGVRIALGASRRSIVNMILRRALLLIAVGTAIGAGGLVAGQALLGRATALLDAPHPVAWLCGAAVTVALTAIGAAYLPAARAAAIDPTVALRSE